MLHIYSNKNQTSWDILTLKNGDKGTSPLKMDVYNRKWNVINCSIKLRAKDIYGCVSYFVFCNEIMRHSGITYDRQSKLWTNSKNQYKTAIY